MLLAHILHNQPNQENKFGVAGTAVVMVGFMVIISYAMYVYANVIGSPFNMFLQVLSSLSSASLPYNLYRHSRLHLCHHLRSQPHYSADSYDAYLCMRNYRLAF